MNNSVAPRTIIITSLIVVLAIIAGGSLLLASSPEPVEIVINPPVPTATPRPTTTPGPITIYVTGAVAHPQTTVSLPANSRVADAIEAAGGTTNDADLDRVNLAGLLNDGDQIHVASLSGEDSNAPEEVVLPTAAGDGLVNVNTASIDDLVTLPGIGQALAQRIIDYRLDNGPFTSLEDLDNVSGIGPSILENIGPMIAID